MKPVRTKMKYILQNRLKTLENVISELFDKEINCLINAS